MGDKDNQGEKPAKKPPVAAAAIKRKRKKGPAASVKIPQGKIYWSQSWVFPIVI